MKFDTIKEATQYWVSTFNAFQYGMMERLAYDKHGNCELEEITPPSKYDRVYYWNAEDVEGNSLEEDDGYGEIIRKEGDRYVIDPDNGDEEIYTSDVYVERDDFFPMWGTMWQFGDGIDEWWLEENLQTMADCGFRIYEHTGEDAWGYFFGIDGAGYDFYEEHWIPLYKARGLHWHNEEDKEDAA